MNCNQKRISWIDSCKGLATILVVIGHIADGYLGANLFVEYTSLMEHIFNLIYSFHMPLFFVLSGYVFYLAYCRNYTLKKNKFRIQVFNLIYIYSIMCCVQWVFKTIFSNNVNGKLTIRDLILIPIKPISPYWYLYVLIFFYIIFILVEKIHIYEKYKLATCFFISTFGSLVSVDSPFPLRRIIIYSFFFYLGIFFAKEEYAIKYITQTKNLISGGICSMLIFAASIITNRNLLKIDIIGICTAAIISIFIIGLFAKNEYSNKFLDLCGKYSLEIYIIHCFITAANRVILVKLHITNFYVNVLVNLMMAVFIPIICSLILKKLKLYTIFLRPFSLRTKKETQ